MTEKSQAVVAHMATTVAAISSASAAAEALLNQTSEHIRGLVDNVDTADADDVDNCLDELSAFADQLDQQATELSAAVTANTPSEGANASGGAASGTLDPHSIEGAAAAGGYNAQDGSAPAPAVEQTLPPAAGQHEDAEVEQPQNSTLSGLESGSASGDTTDTAGAGTGDQSTGAEGTAGSSQGSDSAAATADEGDTTTGDDAA